MMVSASTLGARARTPRTNGRTADTWRLAPNRWG